MMLISDALKKSTLLTNDCARLETEILLAWALKQTRTWLYTWPEKSLSSAQQAKFEQALIRRQKGEPIAYIVGEKEFWSLPLSVDDSTLIPRNDTETLVEVALSFATAKSGSALSILDLGCGTGAIGLALASELPSAHIFAVDRVDSAVALARKNTSKLNLTNVQVKASDWFSCFTQESHNSFDIIVSNPPYIDENDCHLLQGDVRFEPSSALVAHSHGLADLEHIIKSASLYLRNGGALILEHGWQQADNVAAFLLDSGFQNINLHRDLSGNNRVTSGQYFQTAL